MKRINLATIAICLGLDWSDLASPGQFRFALPIDQVRSIASLKPKVGDKIKSGMAQFESAEFISKVCPSGNPRGISVAQIATFAAARPESGLTADRVQELLGLPDCADGSIARYFAADGSTLVVGYKSGKTTGFELKTYAN